jgi:hypothetical protein
MISTIIFFVINIILCAIAILVYLRYRKTTHGDLDCKLNLISKQLKDLYDEQQRYACNHNRKLLEIITHQTNIMANQTELAQALLGIQEQLTKASGEIVAKIGELEAAIAAAGNTTPEVDALVSEIKSIAEGLDGIVPDPTTETPTEGEPTV